MATEIRVLPRDEGWEVRVDGLPVDQLRTRQSAEAVARRAAREHGPAARVDVQSRFTGTWKTLVAW